MYEVWSNSRCTQEVRSEASTFHRLANNRAIISLVSICIAPTPKPRFNSHTPRKSLVIHDLTFPNVIRNPDPPKQAQAENFGMMAVHEALARRINMRLDVEVSAIRGNARGYKRLRCASVLISAPNAEQAELFIQAIHDFAASLNGKWLAPKPPEPEQPVKP